ncbi:MAG: LLM class flavin-dependent oxidoreductase [Candidatus Geothermarchaeales archaeon]
MYYGIYASIAGDCADAHTLAGLARDAEGAGWDGFFIWDHISRYSDSGMVDPWIALAAIAINTERIRIGPMVTPLPRRRPWKVARETASLDNLSGGRMVLGVGLGVPENRRDFEYLGEPSDAKVRATMLDEALDVLTGLWSGEPFSYRGQHYRLKETLFLPTPIQSPRIPIWVAGMWPKKAPFRRAARWDGVFPLKLGLDERLKPEDLRDILTYIKKHRAGGMVFDVVHSGVTSGRDREQDADMVARYAEVGVTWWLEVTWLQKDIEKWRPSSLEEMQARIRRGPPKV